LKTEITGGSTHLGKATDPNRLQIISPAPWNDQSTGVCIERREESLTDSGDGDVEDGFR
jgi:hypothetical protein